jgi:hypothetical protein
MEGLLLAIGYEVVVASTLLVVAKRYSYEKHAESEYDWLYFLRFSVTCVMLAQTGFIVLVSALFWNQHSLAVGLSALMGIPGILLLVMLMMRTFAMEYRSIYNMIRRLENMPPEARETFLESLPPEIYRQIPGDYRIVSKQREL